MDDKFTIIEAKKILTKSSSKFLFKSSCTFVLVIELVNISRNSASNNPSKCRSRDIKSNTNQRDRPLSLYFFMTFLRYEINSELEELNLNNIQIPYQLLYTYILEAKTIRLHSGSVAIFTDSCGLLRYSITI